MSEQTHTPGPWRHYQDTKHAPGYIEDESRSYIAAMEFDGAGFDAKTCLANAQLIAAAPELLEALRDLRDSVQALHVGADERVLDCVVCQCLDRAEAAIAKAKGGTA
ncbi:MAG: hypothetical protein ACLFV3_09220 [Phycisphaeraceae bacterium]